MATGSTTAGTTDYVMELAKQLRNAMVGRAQVVSSEAMDALKRQLEDRLAPLPGTPPLPDWTVFPTNTDALLSTFDAATPTELRDLASEYFSGPWQPPPVLLAAAGGQPTGLAAPPWSQVCCPLQPRDVRLAGTRHRYFPSTTTSLMRRTLTGDLIWLYYMERMGLFKILGAILDDYATRGKYPILSNDATAAALEVMVREVKQGGSSIVRDRDSTYRRCLGWTSEPGRRLGSTATVNGDFNTHFHKVIQLALEYYKDLRLADAIRGDLANAKSSVATLTSIKDTAILLKQSLDPFTYGRTATNTLAGITWVIATLGLTQKLIQSLGIPTNFTDPDKFIPAAYELLVMNRAPGSAESRRYTAHLDAARNGRRILLDLEVLNLDNATELETWLAVAEPAIEGYRTAYRTLTGVDLGAGGTPTIEQQA